MKRLRLAVGLIAAFGCGEAPPEDPVLARLGGEPIRRSELSAEAAFRMYRSDVQDYRLLEEEARRIADERVLAEAARREGLSPAALLARIESAAPKVEEADVERYLAAHAERSAAPESARARTRAYLEERGRIERRLAFFEEQRERAGFEWLLERPVVPRVAIDARDAPARGPATAPLTIVHLASFGSADSARSAAAIARLAAELPEQVRWLHLNFLREGDEAGLRGAELAFLAQDAGHFWQAHDALFACAGRLDAAALDAAAQAAGLGAGARERTDQGALRRRVQADLALARRSGALREPTLFVNGRYWSGLGPYAELVQLARDELALAAAANVR